MTSLKLQGMSRLVFTIWVNLMMSESNSKIKQVSGGNRDLRHDSVYFDQLHLSKDGPHLLDFWKVFIKFKWVCVALFLLPILISFVVTLISPNKYTAEVSLYPVSGNSGGSGLAGLASQFSSIPLIGSQLGSLGGDKAKEIVSILKSRTLAEKAIQRYDLLKVLFPERWDAQLNQFEPAAPPMESGVWKFHKYHYDVVYQKKTGLVNINVILEDPELAAKVANFMVLGLQDFISNHSLTVEKRNRIFVEEQLVKNRAKLLEAGVALNKFYGSDKISSVIPELDVMVGTYQIQPETFEGFRESLASLEQSQSDAEQRVQRARVENVPGRVYLEYLTLNRQLLAKVNALLTQQYEIAKIDEAKEDLAFQVIDWAVAKVNPSSPSLKINLALGLVLGLFLMLTFIFFKAYVIKLRGRGSVV